MSERTLEQVQFEADQVTNESLAASRRMVAMAEETRQVGARSLDTLDQQHEQLQRVHGHVTAINADMRGADKSLNQLERCCGLFSCNIFRRRVHRTKKYRDAWSKSVVPAIDARGAEDSVPPPPVPPASLKRNSASFIQRVTNDAREDEINENLETTHGIILDLKAQALAMNEELDKQNTLIGEISKRTDTNIDHIEEGSRRVGKLLR